MTLAGKYALCDLLSAGEEMTFVYDFGDSWRHTVKVIFIIPENTLGAPRG